jgi:hypothetical protein
MVNYTIKYEVIGLFKQRSMVAYGPKSMIGHVFSPQKIVGCIIRKFCINNLIYDFKINNATFDYKFL